MTQWSGGQKLETNPQLVFDFSDIVDGQPLRRAECVGKDEGRVILFRGETNLRMRSQPRPFRRAQNVHRLRR